MDRLHVELPSSTDPPDIDVLNKAIEAIVNALNIHVESNETLEATKVSLLMQIVRETSFFNSNVTSLFNQLNACTNDGDRIIVLKQIVNEIALFGSANGKNILEQLNALF